MTILPLRRRRPTLTWPSFFVALLALAILAIQPEPARALGENVETFTLDNGLEVVVIPDRRAPVVTHMVWYRVGAADEAPGESGIAHYLEHLMFKGTETNPDGEFSRVIAEIGGQENAFTSLDYTAYFQRVSKEHLGLMMEFEADRMANLVLSEEDAETELNVVIEERKSRTDNDPGAQLGEAMSAALYMSHPYALPVIGWMHEIEQLDRETALAFYDIHYTPNNAILIVAGDVEVDEVRALAESTYGKLERRAEPPPRVRPQAPPQRTARTVTMVDPRVTQESLRRFYLAPSYTTAEPGEAEAIELMIELLGGGATSHLYRELVVERQIASSAGAWYRGSALDDSQVALYGVPRPGVTLDDLEAAIDAEIADFIATPVDEVALERAKRKMIAEAVYAQDSQSTLARIYGIALTTGSSVEAVATWTDRIAAVTAEQVVEAARDHLDMRASVTGYLMAEPMETAEPAEGGSRS